jgi:thioredoxin 1
MSPSREHDVAGTIHLTEQSFDEAVAAAQGLVMVDFWAAMKVDVDENPGLAARYGIRSIPTILFVKQATVVDRIVGAVPRAVVQDIVDARAS